MKNNSTVIIPPPVKLGRDSKERAQKRGRLARVLWNVDGSRRLPARKQLLDALRACDERDVFWVCEANSHGPLYLLPSREWISALAKFIDNLGARSILEVGAGDGFLAACLREARPLLRIIATDSGAWSKAQARMNSKEQRDLRATAIAGLKLGPLVGRMSARTALRRYPADLVLVSWAPPGLLVEQMIQGPSKFILDLSCDGDVCGNGALTWRFNKEFVDGPVQEKCLCRLDGGRRAIFHSRVMLYYGSRHPDFYEERF